MEVFQHKVLAGLDFQKLRLDETFGTNFAEPSINIFNPVYGVPVTTPALSGSLLTKQNQFGFYAQDQMKIDRTTFVIGGRIDRATSDVSDDILNTSSSQLDVAKTWRAAVIHVFENGVGALIATAMPFRTAIAPIERPGADVFSAATIERGRLAAASGAVISVTSAMTAPRLPEVVRLRRLLAR